MAWKAWFKSWNKCVEHLWFLILIQMFAISHLRFEHSVGKKQAIIDEPRSEIQSKWTGLDIGFTQSLTVIPEEMGTKVMASKIWALEVNEWLQFKIDLKRHFFPKHLMKFLYPFDQMSPTLPTLRKFNGTMVGWECFIYVCVK